MRLEIEYDDGMITSHNADSAVTVLITDRCPIARLELIDETQEENVVIVQPGK